MNKIFNTVALVLILWMVIHRNDNFNESEKVKKIKEENVQVIAVPTSNIDAGRNQCGSLTDLDQVVWAFHNKPEALLGADSPLFTR